MLLFENYFCAIAWGFLIFTLIAGESNIEVSNYGCTFYIILIIAIMSQNSFRAANTYELKVIKPWSTPESSDNYCSSVESDDSDIFDVGPIESAENIKTTHALADHNYCTLYEKEEIENLETFENILQSHDKNNTITIEKYQTTRSTLSKNLQNYTFCGTRVQNYIKRLVVKRNPIENEKKAYEKVFPLLENLKENPIIWPVPNYSINGDMIIFDDLSAEGFRKIEDKTFTVRECSMVLMNLAEFHKTSLVLQFQNPVEFQALELSYIEDAHSEFIAYLNGLSYRQSFNKIFNPAEQNTLKVLIYQAKINNQTRNKFSAICHGNLLPTNIFFKESEVRFLDFKHMHYGSIARDVMCFMIAALEPNFNSFSYLLSSYFRCFTGSSKLDTLMNLNYNFTSESFKQEVDKMTAYGILYSIWSIPVLYANSDEELKTLRRILDNTAEKRHSDFVRRIKKLLTWYQSLPLYCACI